MKISLHSLFYSALICFVMTLSQQGCFDLVDAATVMPVDVSDTTEFTCGHISCASTIIPFVALVHNILYRSSSMGLQHSMLATSVTPTKRQHVALLMSSMLAWLVTLIRMASAHHHQQETGATVLVAVSLLICSSLPGSTCGQTHSPDGPCEQEYTLWYQWDMLSSY